MGRSVCHLVAPRKEGKKLELKTSSVFNFLLHTKPEAFRSRESLEAGAG